MTAYDVYLRRRNIDTVFYGQRPRFSTRAEREEDVRRSLVNHDGYDSEIVVRERREKKIEKNARRTIRSKYSVPGLSTNIEALRSNVRYLQSEIKSRDEGIHRLVVYLQSPKFRNDTTVQVQDVLNRLMEIYR